MQRYCDQLDYYIKHEQKVSWEKIVKVESGKLVRKFLPYLDKNKDAWGSEVERRRGQFLNQL